MMEVGIININLIISTWLNLLVFYLFQGRRSCEVILQEICRNFISDVRLRREADKKITRISGLKSKP